MPGQVPQAPPPSGDAVSKNPLGPVGLARTPYWHTRSLLVKTVSQYSASVMDNLNLLFNAVTSCWGGRWFRTSHLKMCLCDPDRCGSVGWMSHCKLKGHKLVRAQA